MLKFALLCQSLYLLSEEKVQSHLSVKCWSQRNRFSDAEKFPAPAVLPAIIFGRSFFKSLASWS